MTVQPNGETLAVGKPATIIEKSYFNGGTTYGRAYDVASDGRFLMIKGDASVDRRPTSPSLVIVQHWLEELKHLLPVR